MIIVRKHSEYAVGGLMGVVVTQALGYGLIFDINFFLRNLSVVGGLLMVLSDSWVRKRFVPAGLPQMDEKDRKMYVQLAGRVLLIFLFVGFVYSGEWSFGRVIVSLFGLGACVMVVVGFKAKASAVMLVLILSIFNLFVNNWWTVSCVCRLCRLTWLTAPKAAPLASEQGLRQVRLLPDPVHCRRTATLGQHGPRPVLRGREEEGLLEPVSRRPTNARAPGRRRRPSPPPTSSSRGMSRTLYSSCVAWERRRTNEAKDGEEKGPDPRSMCGLLNLASRPGHIGVYLSSCARTPMKCFDTRESKCRDFFYSARLR